MTDVTNTVSRDAIRSAIFNQKVQSTEMTFAGVKIELRQPAVGVVIARDTQGDRKEFMTKMLIDYCFVPGTNEHVFEDADHEMLMAMPFNADWVELQKKIDSLTDLGTIKEEQVKN